MSGSGKGKEQKSTRHRGDRSDWSHTNRTASTIERCKVWLWRVSKPYTACITGPEGLALGDHLLLQDHHLLPMGQSPRFGKASTLGHLLCNHPVLVWGTPGDPVGRQSASLADPMFTLGVCGFQVNTAYARLLQDTYCRTHTETDLCFIWNSNLTRRLLFFLLNLAVLSRPQCDTNTQGWRGRLMTAREVEGTRPEEVGEQLSAALQGFRKHLQSRGSVNRKHGLSTAVRSMCLQRGNKWPELGGICGAQSPASVGFELFLIFHKSENLSRA